MNRGLAVNARVQRGEAFVREGFALGLFSAVIVLRALAVGNPVWAVAANALSPIGGASSCRR